MQDGLYNGGSGGIMGITVSYSAVILSKED